ncbi:hypothetical protein AN965_15875 [Alkalicoccobacillus plakortidis]|uniref:Uncharacterized protein n=1 Tax=Alkalicoccobacillus plakortidis TaxID=444060 RepID=A0A9D5DLF1_9BACI|nr:hypothetical protein AN965_15875 [Alkalicoccobacillus plakortidis]
MYLLTGVISLIFTFIFITYLYGLNQIYSSMFSPGLVIFPVVLLTIACYSLYRYYTKEMKK